VIHYHGGSISGPETCAWRAWRRGHAFISYTDTTQLELAASITESFALDNGAYSVWKAGATPDWPGYYDWCARWLAHPACDWAIIPDVIGGTEAENDALLAEWPHPGRGVPVWHLDESPERLEALARIWPRIALGSAAEYDASHPRRCVARLRDVLPAISDDGVPRVKLHGLRMLNPEIVTRVPLSSADSVNLGRNAAYGQKWRGPYEPATQETRIEVLRERIEQHQAPGRLETVDVVHAETLFDGWAS
jgi:hypothetical protein